MEFIEENGGGPGVRLKKRRQKRKAQLKFAKRPQFDRERSKKSGDAEAELRALLLYDGQRPKSRIHRRLVDLQQCGETFTHFIKQLDWSDASHFNVSFLPGDAAYLIHQNDAGYGVPIWNGNFKRIASRSGRNWTNDTQSRSHIVLPRR